MENRECIVFERTRDTEQRIHEPCACLWVPYSSRLQPIVGWIHLPPVHIAVAFAGWNFFDFRVKNNKKFQITVIHELSKQIERRNGIGKIFALWHLEIAPTSLYLS